MKEITAYVAVDGKLFEREKDAAEHDENCIGEEFDALLMLAIAATHGNVSRHSQWQMCLELLNNKDKARKIIGTLHRYLNHSRNGEEE